METKNTPVQQPGNGQLAQKPKKQIQEETINAVLSRVEEYIEAGALVLPKDYIPSNALRGAWIMLLQTKDRNEKPALEVCTTESIVEALFKMVTMGLSVLKKHGDFIVYGNKLSFDLEYTGNIVLAKRFGDLIDITPNVVFKSDVFEYEIDPNTGRKRVIKHTQTLESMGETEFRGGYAVYKYKNTAGEIVTNTEIMSMQQIRNAWAMGGAKGNSKAHNNFGDQMIHKTVINRACKLLIRGSSDSALIDDTDSDDQQEKKSEGIKALIKSNSAKKTVTMDGVQDADVVVDRPAPETIVDNPPAEEIHDEFEQN